MSFLCLKQNKQQQQKTQLQTISQTAQNVASAFLLAFGKDPITRTFEKDDSLSSIIRGMKGLLPINASGDVAQLVEHWTGKPPMQVQFPGAAWDFSPRVNFQGRQLHAFKSVCTLKIL